MIGTEFVLAGNAAFTVDNGRGEHYTYRVQYKEPVESFPEAWFVSVLTGPDNTRDFTYVGRLSPQTGDVVFTRKSRYTDDTRSVKVLRWAAKLVWAGKAPPAGYEIRHAGRCGRCGRDLTHPESLESGFGPECREIMAGAA